MCSLMFLNDHTADLHRETLVLPGPESVKNQDLIRVRRRFISQERNKMRRIKIQLYPQHLIEDEDAMDKEVEDKVKDTRVEHNNDDQSSKKPREVVWASASKQQSILSSSGWSSLDHKMRWCYSSMHRSDPESGETSEQSTDDILSRMEGEWTQKEWRTLTTLTFPRCRPLRGFFKPFPQKAMSPVSSETEWTFPQMISWNQNNKWANDYALNVLSSGGKQASKEDI
ncbi:hypothetical protein Tco_0026962 [Tanacetum coccineum]